MPIYPFMCEKCSHSVEIIHSIHDYENIDIPSHCGLKMEQVYFVPAFTAKYTVGKETGLYDYDYGKKSTHDLTPKGKYERLFKEGKVKNQFWEKQVKDGTRKL